MASPAAKAKPAAKKPEKSKATPLDNFAWEGTDNRGKKMKGEIRAANANAAKADLRRQGVTPGKVTKKSKPLFGGAGGKPITPKDIAIFARQLATMMSSGVPLVQSFDIVGKGAENPSLQDLILGIKMDIEGGLSLGDALARQPKYFDDLFCSLVRAGEAAGVLEELLGKIATYKEKSEALKAKVKKALSYPITVMITAVGVTAVIMIFVIPKFEELFSSFGANLPAFTVMVINISKFMQANWWILGGVGYGLFKAFKMVHQNSAEFREQMDRVMLKLPIIGLIVNKSAIARFARTLATMFAAGVPLVEALESVAGATGNIVYQNAVLKIREDIATGQSLQMSMKQVNVFPSMVLQMTAIGEESGALDTMLGKVADFYEEEVDNLVDTLSSLMEPIIMVVLGVLVGGLIVAMYLPIFAMAAAV